MASVFELYRIMVASSEALVARRQGVNTFFLTVNGAIVAAAGFVLGGKLSIQLQSAGLVALAVAGLILALAWRSLLISFGQLNTGKFVVIAELEKHLPASIYSAEWIALGEGKDAKKYRSFTSREVWAPWVFFVIYVVAAVLQVVIAFQLVDLQGWISPWLN